MLGENEENEEDGSFEKLPSPSLSMRLDFNRPDAASTGPGGTPSQLIATLSIEKDVAYAESSLAKNRIRLPAMQYCDGIVSVTSA